MYMEDYIEHLDRILSATGERLLEGAGTVSHSQALEKAKEEYLKYQQQTLSPVEEEYLKSIKMLTEATKKDTPKDKA